MVEESRMLEFMVVLLDLQNSDLHFWVSHEIASAMRSTVDKHILRVWLGFNIIEYSYDIRWWCKTVWWVIEDYKSEIGNFLDVIWMCKI